MPLVGCSTAPPLGVLHAYHPSAGFSAAPFKVYSGYLEVPGPFKLTNYDSLKIHYQFHQAQSNAESSPVVTWHQGGPGGSSLYVRVFGGRCHAAKRREAPRNGVLVPRVRSSGSCARTVRVQQSLKCALAVLVQSFDVCMQDLHYAAASPCRRAHSRMPLVGSSTAYPYP